MRIISNQELLCVAGGSEGEESIEGEFNDYSFIDGGSGGKTKGGGGGGGNSGPGSSSGGGSTAQGTTPTSGSSASQTDSGSTSCSSVSNPNGSSLSMCQSGDILVVQSCTGTIAGSASVNTKVGGGSLGGSGNICITRVFNKGVEIYGPQ